MLRIQSSSAGEAAGEFVHEPAEPGEDNLGWLARTAPLAGADEDETCLLLLGARGQVPFRVRIAQAHLRHDLTPSHWSHVAMLRDRPAAGTPEAFGRCRVVEVPLEPTGAGWNPTEHNGLHDSTLLSAYRDAGRYPNVAVLRLPVPVAAWADRASADRQSVLDRYERQRNELDATDLILRWLAFCWGVGHTSNPLLDGQGLPGAAMAELVLAAVGYEITPQLDSRSSCPEAIWQSAKWWHTYYEDASRHDPMRGVWKVQHRIVP